MLAPAEFKLAWPGLNTPSGASRVKPKPSTRLTIGVTLNLTLQSRRPDSRLSIKHTTTASVLQLSYHLSLIHSPLDVADPLLSCYL